ncbi:MAG TPA: CsgG/HfaB family protein [Gemmatimonadales bacterium]|jgi:TolB-like protein|nr:CsgG/HfaB family protein [Gemmatimonadales bacterium]
MRWRSVWALGLAAGLAAPVAQGQDSRPGIAVFPFDNGGSYGQDKENFDALQVGLQQMLITEFAQNPQLRIVERGRIKDLLAEQDLGASGRVDANTAAKLGKLVGARYVVLGGFIDFYGDFRIDARIVNVETSELVKVVKVNDKRDKLYGLVVSLAGSVTRDVNLPALPRQAMEQRESRQVPTEALQLYSRALLYADRGDASRAAELFNRAIEVFPEYTEAQEGLRQLKQG